MTNEAETMDLWKTSVKKDIEEMKGDIRRLQDKTLLQDQIIQNIQGDLKEIKEDTKEQLQMPLICPFSLL
ncbi:hypothetical protein KM915_24990 [Cytobacillus oceanisediminis]|uniref:hypothetical protein n=1 Tax=Cytobacillus oceanisediminis TaxID=665099 RepID=UPI001C23B9B3|nr:hypothetical protein [Cytobacillus oceanisediminis]MBU8733271.1 hypothetical protein [Cytobacillus oceanisediminis]